MPGLPALAASGRGHALPLDEPLRGLGRPPRVDCGIRAPPDQVQSLASVTFGRVITVCRTKDLVVLRRTSEVSIFGCGREQMTLAQRASVPLSLRSMRETLVQRSERDPQVRPPRP